MFRAVNETMLFIYWQYSDEQSPIAFIYAIIDGWLWVHSLHQAVNQLFSWTEVLVLFRYYSKLLLGAPHGSWRWNLIWRVQRFSQFSQVCDWDNSSACDQDKGGCIDPHSPTTRGLSTMAYFDPWYVHVLVTSWQKCSPNTYNQFASYALNMQYVFMYIHIYGKTYVQYFKQSWLSFVTPV